jgi:hypothetical protein
LEIERRIELSGNRAAAAARAMFPQSRHPVSLSLVGGWGYERRLGKCFFVRQEVVHPPFPRWWWWGGGVLVAPILGWE